MIWARYDKLFFTMQKAVKIYGVGNGQNRSFVSNRHKELVDQALAKVIEFEIDRLQQEQRRLKAELVHFETSHQMTSEECQRKFDAGELGDAVEFFEWTSLYSIYQQNEHLLRLLEDKLV